MKDIILEMKDIILEMKDIILEMKDIILEMRLQLYLALGLSKTSRTSNTSIQKYIFIVVMQIDG